MIKPNRINLGLIVFIHLGLFKAMHWKKAFILTFTTMGNLENPIANVHFFGLREKTPHRLVLSPHIKPSFLGR